MCEGMYRAMPSQCGRMQLYKLAQQSSPLSQKWLDVGIYKNVNPRVKVPLVRIHQM